MTITTDMAPALTHAQILRVTFEALGRRALRWVSLAMSFALFAYAAARPEPWRLVAAAAFTCACYLPFWWHRE